MQGALSLLNESPGSKLPASADDDIPTEDDLELGLGLSLGGGKSKATGWGECGRILTAKDFPSVVNSNNNRNTSLPNASSKSISVSGNKRAADSVPHDSGSPPAASQVVGWPPVGAHRLSSLVNNQTKSPRSGDDEKVGSEKDNTKSNTKDASKKKICNNGNVFSNEKTHLGFVKVNMDGLPIGRKVDLNAHASYDTLAQALEDMFFNNSKSINLIGSGGEKDKGSNSSKLLDGSSEFVLTYEDKEGDWMLVGDVPWRMFLSSVKRLRIMRTSEANGLAPRFQERAERQRAKPI